MSNKQKAFLTAWSGAALLMFGASAVEYAGFDFTMLAGILAVTGVLCSLLAAFFACKILHEGKNSPSILILIGTASAPFLVHLLLRLNGTEVNVHGFAIMGFLLYLFFSEVLAVSLAIGLIVQTFRRRVGKLP